MTELSSNTKAILLLTAPLMARRGTTDPEPLGPGEYKRIAQHLRAIRSEPADLLLPGATEILTSCAPFFDADRLHRLLGRGMLLSQAVERWRTRAIWVVSRADPGYPRRLKARLGGNSPALLYGCGDIGLLEQGGLAVVGSRNVDDTLVDYTMRIGRLVAESDRTLVSGGARGIDQAAMQGALEAGGRVCGVLADSLEKQVMLREHRNMVIDQQLALVSPYDPGAGFNVGHAMARNKLIYALGDAALVVSSDLGKGGTWAGAVEQLEKFGLGPIYVRSTGDPMPGLEALKAKGALDWPNPSDAHALGEVLALEQTAPDPITLPDEREMRPQTSMLGGPEDAFDQGQSRTSTPDQVDRPEATAAEILFSAVQQAIEMLLIHPMKDVEIADALDVSTVQVRSWLDRLVETGMVERKKKPVSYVLKGERLFDR